MSLITRERLLEWAVAALIRALRTWAQAGVAYIGTSAVGILGFDWIGFFSITAMSFLLSLLTSVAGLPEASDGKDLPTIMTSVEGDHAN